MQRAIEVARRFDTLRPASAAAYEQAASATRVLVPIALVLMTIAIALVLQSAFEAGVVLLCAAWATVVVAGALGWLGVAWTPALSILPVLALGAGLVTRRASPLVALAIASGLGAFAVTDVAPLRTFAIAGAIVVVLTWAVLSLFEVAQEPPAWAPLRGFLVRHRLLFVVACLLPSLFFISPLRHLMVHAKPPAVSVSADRELIFDVAVAGELEQPAALRELAHLVDYASTLEGVSEVESILEPLVAANHGLGAGYRLPHTVAESQRLFTVLGPQPLLSRDHRDTLVRVHAGEHAEAVMEALEKWAAGLQTVGWPSRADATAEVALVFQRPGVPRPDAAMIEHAAEQLEIPGPDDTLLQTLRERTTLDAIMSGSAPKLHQDQKAVVELAIERQSAGWQALWRKAALRPEEVDVAAPALTEKLLGLPRSIAVERALRALTEAAQTGDLPVPVQHRVERAVDDLFAPPAQVVAVALKGTVGGAPVLLRGLDRAVRFALRTSLLVAFGLVALIALAALRSWRAILCLLVPGLAIVYVFGGLGVVHGTVDLGAALVPALVVGSGCAIQLRERAILALPLAVGFLVLCLIHAPLSLPGSLASVATALCALLAYVLGRRSQSETGALE